MICVDRSLLFLWGRPVIDATGRVWSWFSFANSVHATSASLSLPGAHVGEWSWTVFDVSEL